MNEKKSEKKSLFLFILTAEYMFLAKGNSCTFGYPSIYIYMRWRQTDTVRKLYRFFLLWLAIARSFYLRYGFACEQTN